MKKIFLLFNAFFALQAYSQIQENTIKQSINQSFKYAKIDNFLVESNYSSANKITHVYLKQTYNNLPIFNASAAVHLNKDGKVVYKTGEFFNTANAKINNNFNLAVTNAMQIAASSKSINLSTSTLKNVLNTNGKFEILDANASTEKVFGKQGYIFLNNQLLPVWQIEVYQDATNDWWCIFINADNGIKIDEHSYTAHCNPSEIVSGNSNYVGFNFADYNQTISLGKNANEPSYNALPLPLENPAKGQRQMLTQIASVIASPYGWHDTDGVAGAEYTVTRGNNVFAKEDTAAKNSVNGYSAPADSTFSFNFPWGIDARPRENLDAAITNLFVWNNYLHDVMYNYGFTTASGNFQLKNYDSLGLGKDQVHAEAQDGNGTNNANFSTPVDGSTPRMQMYLWPTSNSTKFLTVTAPSSVAKDYTAPQASFGSKLGETPIIARIVLYKDTNTTTSDGCVLASNSADLNGNIAFINRGGSCNTTYTTKVLNAQKAGAIAVIIGHNSSNTPITMSGTSTQINIPSVMIGLTDANNLKAKLETDTVMGKMFDPNANTRVYDSDFDNGVIAHEYGHGISNRLTGGPANSSCLQNQEQAGEGWSDFFALVLTTRKWESGNTARGIGTFLINQDTNGIGIRPYRYSRNLLVNPVTYNSIKTLSVPHGVGFVFASVLYDIMWDMVDVYGFDEDLFHGTGGNNKTLQLVMDGLKLQKCSPGFMDARDAIILADSLNNGGVNKVLLWKAFARRGMGYSANQGLSTSRSDGAEAFDLPPGLTNGFANINADKNYMLYPNPFNKNLNVQTSNNIKSINIYNLAGKIMATYNFTDLNKMVEINTENLTNGFYLININTDTESYTTKIIKN